MSANAECLEANLAGFLTTLAFGLALLVFAILPMSASAESPGVTTEAASGVTHNTATLNGSVNPHGFETKYRFEYGTTTSYGTSVPVPDKSGGSGTSGVKVSETASGLKANTTYHFRIAAISAEGSSFGKDETFTTKTNPPTVTALAASEVTSTTATLNGMVNPNGLETTYRFEYGTTTSYGTSVPVPDKGIGSGTSNVKVSEKISGLTPATTYNFRVVATSSEGTSFGNNKKFTTTDPRFSFAFGSEGSGNGQFLYPEGIEADPEGNVWVVDTYNSRIQQFDSNGEYLSKFGSEGSGNGQFSAPADIAIDSSENIWVVDTVNNRIQQFDSNGEYLSKFGSEGKGKGQLLYPTGIAIDSSENIWVADTSNHRVQKFNSSGTYQSTFGEGAFWYPTDIATDSEGNVWVIDSGNNRVMKLDSKGEYLGEFGSYGTGNGEFNNPDSIAIDSNDNAWVVDRYNARVQVFNSNGEYQGKFGSIGKFGEKADKFLEPTGIAIDSIGDVWVADFSRSEVLKWTLPSPTTTTEAADELTKEAATLHGTVNPNGLETTYRFEYGTTTSYGTSVPVSDKGIGSGMNGVKVNEGISGLKSATTYHFRVVATNIQGTSFGKDETFVTK